MLGVVAFVLLLMFALALFAGGNPSGDDDDREPWDDLTDDDRRELRRWHMN